MSVKKKVEVRDTVLLQKIAERDTRKMGEQVERGRASSVEQELFTQQEVQRVMAMEIARLDRRVEEAEKATVPFASFVIDANDRLRKVEVLLSQRRGLEVEQGQAIQQLGKKIEGVAYQWALQTVETRIKALETQVASLYAQSTAGKDPKDEHPLGCRCPDCEEKEHVAGCRCSECEEYDPNDE